MSKIDEIMSVARKVAESQIEAVETLDTMYALLKELKTTSNDIGAMTAVMATENTLHKTQRVQAGMTSVVADIGDLIVSITLLSGPARG